MSTVETPQADPALCVGANGRSTSRASYRPPCVLIADYPETCAGIRLALEVEVCAEVSNAVEAIRAAKREQPDVCLVGQHLCGERLRVVRAICRAAPDAAVVVLAEHHDVDDFLDAIRAGAIGYVPGPLDGERLRRVLGAITSNEAVVPRSLVLELLREVRGSREGLTARESEVRGLLAAATRRPRSHSAWTFHRSPCDGTSPTWYTSSGSRIGPR